LSRKLPAPVGAPHVAGGDPRQENRERGEG
jgi:hypothetical protein